MYRMHLRSGASLAHGFYICNEFAKKSIIQLTNISRAEGIPNDLLYTLDLLFASILPYVPSPKPFADSMKCPLRATQLAIIEV